MGIYGQVEVNDYIACVIRSTVAQLGGDERVTMAIVMAESGFDPNALGDYSPTPEVVVNGTVYAPYQNPLDGLYYCSLGLLQLNMCGGQGAGHTGAELLDPRRNMQIGQVPIALATLKGQTLGLQGRYLCEYVAVNSGHPGIVPTTDPRVVTIGQDYVKLITTPLGRLAAWPTYDPAACSGTPPPPAPLGVWCEPYAATTQDEVQALIEAHMQRVNDLFLATS